jgi:hypothetical protein
MELAKARSREAYFDIARTFFMRLGLVVSANRRTLSLF